MQKYKDKYIYVFVLLVLGLFKLAQNLSDYPIEWLYSILPEINNGSLDMFLQQLVADLFVAIVMFVVLLITKRGKLLTKKGIGFFKSFPLAAYPLIYSVVVLVTQVYVSFTEGYPLNSPSIIIIYVLCMFMVGLSEELCTRAIVAESLLEHYGTNKKGIYVSAIVSGVLFGLLHLFNLNVQEPMSVIVQSILAAVGGITYAAIYFRSGNIWILVFVHMLNDIASGTTYGIFNAGDMAEAMASTTGDGALYGLVLAIPEIFVIIHLLRDQKLHEVKENWYEIKD